MPYSICLAVALVFLPRGLLTGFLLNFIFTTFFMFNRDKVSYEKSWTEIHDESIQVT